MFSKMKDDINKTVSGLKQKGMYKGERVIKTPQGALIETDTNGKVLNFCSNNYLGLADNREVIAASKKAMDEYGFGLSSVRFICGTQSLHKKLEQEVSRFLGTEDTILYSSAFDANGGVFEPLLTAEDIIISDTLNHASIIDGIRLCKAERERYAHSDMEDLERILGNTGNKRYRMIATDGVFSMDGDIADLKSICILAERYDALVLVDDSHATGYIGKSGRGTPEYCGVEGRVDIITTTFGKALGGASGGCISGRKEIIEILRQKSRPYLFSNTLAPAVAGGVLKAIEITSSNRALTDVPLENAGIFKREIKKAGFDIVDGDTAIVPIMLYDEATAVKMADMLLEEGIYVVGFTYPVVPKGMARIRVQF
ncbi:MAG: glycine C-acetyltransferase, partial [Spirochaetes bacterium]